MTLEWSDELHATGYEDIDNDHRVLVGVLNELVSDLRKGNLVKTMDRTLRFLDKYTTDHFQKEEDVMRATQCKGYSQNKKEHLEFERKLLNFKHQFDDEGYTRANLKEFLNYLTTWVSNHMLKTDILLRTTLEE